MTTPTDTQDQDSNLHESVYFKTTTQLSPQQLEVIAKKANWEQAKIVYAGEIGKLLISARIDENKMYLHETDRHYYPSSPDDPYIPLVQFDRRIAELTKPITNQKPS